MASDKLTFEQRILSAFNDVTVEMRYKSFLSYQDRLHRVILNEGGHVEMANFDSWYFRVDL